MDRQDAPEPPEDEAGVAIADKAHGEQIISAPGVRRSREAALLGLLLLYAVLMWAWGVGRLDIAHSMEAARAIGARTMMRTGDYLIPQVEGRINLAKPPLFYWLVTMTSRLCGGTGETAVRLPSAFCAIAVLLVMYFSLRSVFGPLKAYAACFIAATLPMVSPAATVGEVNMLLALGVAISVFSAFHMLERPRHGWFYAALCGTGLAIGMMAKGPIALLFFLPTVLLYMGYRHGGALATGWRRSLAYMVVMALLFRLSLWAAVRAGAVGGLRWPSTWTRGSRGFVTRWFQMDMPSSVLTAARWTGQSYRRSTVTRSSHALTTREATSCC